MDLRDAIARLGRVEGNLLLVDDFLNHRVDTPLLATIGSSLAAIFADRNPSLVLTAEASGIPPGLATATALRVPLVYAKKYLGPGDRYAFYREVVSPTKGTEYRVEVARRVLDPGMRVAIVDDFLSGGRTARALGEITEEAGAEVTGFGFVIEKTFMEGRSRLEAEGWAVDALVRIAALTDGRPVFAN